MLFTFHNWKFISNVYWLGYASRIGDVFPPFPPPNHYLGTYRNTQMDPTTNCQIFQNLIKILNFQHK